ncbi:aldehyde dehydrogenase [Cohnella suwonensis]|uniref:Aldehyde dehydrogenase n=1 Tax=Cohnella suwonensis TaxID=696072 RepID=A0ABW0M011_9BACL
MTFASPQPAGADSLSEIVQRQRDFFRSGATRDVAYRRTQLERLRQAVVRLEPELLAALRSDLNKPETEGYALEIGQVLAEIRFAASRVRRWAKPKRVRTPMTHVGSGSRIQYEPLGTTLIIGPWNYPIQLVLIPAIAAIAAGNTVVLKPSEMASATSAVLAKLVSETFSAEAVALAEGGAETSQALLQLPFDHIFYTGNATVGRIVMEAAAKRLIPVTLELGGKSPCIVHDDANVELAAKRIAFGKLVNAGQTCVAPDYLLVHENVKTKLTEAIAQVVESFYGADPIAHPDYGRIVNARHFHRVASYLQDGKIVYGGRTDESALKIAPTLLEDVAPESPVMREEIFGPILPIIPYKNIDEVFAAVEMNEKPLALYVFSGDKKFQEKIIGRIPFGGGCINDAIIHLGNPYLPFGGIGPSGTGNYHGEHGFKTFSHCKAVLKQSGRFDLPFRYPGSKLGAKVIRLLMR